MKSIAFISLQFQFIKKTWKTFSGNWLVSLTNKFVLIFFLLSSLLILWRWNTLPAQVPLWYAKVWGEEQLASPVWLWLIPVSALAIHGINFILTVYLTSENLIFTQMIALVSLLANFMSAITIIKILFLVT